MRTRALLCIAAIGLVGACADDHAGDTLAQIEGDHLTLQADQSAEVAHPDVTGPGHVFIAVMKAPSTVMAPALQKGTAGIPPLRAIGGQVRPDPRMAPVRDYRTKLVASHDAVLAFAGASVDSKLYDYTYAINGFAAKLTLEQARKVRNHADVLSVSISKLRPFATDTSPGMLGLDGADGVWETGVDGEGVVIGVIDTGIWPESLSFADDGSYGDAPVGFTGTACDFGNSDQNENDAAFECNGKLVQASAYVANFLDALGGDVTLFSDHEYLSARDGDGHGSHTASTAGGNGDIPVEFLGFDLGTISGIAPRARVSMYKSCWSTVLGDGCFDADSAAAIDAAVADGVDVINFSVGGPTPDLFSAASMGYLDAAGAGVFVATSAGNSGPAPYTIGSPSASPWLTTVGASTHGRAFKGDFVMGDGSSVTGASVNGPSPGAPNHLPLVPGGLCYPEELHPDWHSGVIVLCERGDFARVDKSANAAAVGAAGMVLYNSFPGQGTVADPHIIPSVHIDYDEFVAFLDYYFTVPEDEWPLGHLPGSYKALDPAPVMAGFSSRGGNGAQEEFVKPDVTAPGVDIAAAFSPTNPFAPLDYVLLSGTSMSSPHVAGIGALMKQAHPDWSPWAIKSALMTTAHQDVVKEDGATAADPFDFGAGHVNPARAIFEPGLVYDTSYFDYWGYMCGQGLIDPGYCAYIGENFGVPIETTANTLNLPSIGAVVVTPVTVTRSLTNVSDKHRKFVPILDIPEGIGATLDVKWLDLKPGDTGTFNITFTNEGAAGGSWSFGSIAWETNTGPNKWWRVARSPIAVKIGSLVAPAEIVTTGTEGSVSFDVTYVGDNPYGAAMSGLVPAVIDPNNVVQDPAQDINAAIGTCDLGPVPGATLPTGCVGITWHIVPIDPGVTVAARVALFDAATDGAGDDLDLFIFDDAFNFLGQSAAGGSTETVDLFAPATGHLLVAVHGWFADGGDSNYALFSWVSGADAGNTVLDVPALASGETGTVTATWSGLATGTAYGGVILHLDGATPIGATLLGVDTGLLGPAPASAGFDKGVVYQPVSSDN